MQCFEFVFRLKDNFYKSRFGRIGVKGEIIERYSSYFNYRILHHPFSLFGYVNGTNPNKKETWDPIIANLPRSLHLGSIMLELGDAGHDVEGFVTIVVVIKESGGEVKDGGFLSMQYWR